MLGFGRACERIRTGSATAFTPPIAASATGVIAPAAASVALRALLGNKLLQLAVFEHLAESAHGKAENGNR